jgi:hypothetical protein
MEKTHNGNITLVSGLRRALELWPYGFIAVSIAGLSYMALQAAR